MKPELLKDKGVGHENHEAQKNHRKSPAPGALFEPKFSEQPPRYHQKEERQNEDMPGEKHKEVRVLPEGPVFGTHEVAAACDGCDKRRNQSRAQQKARARTVGAEHFP